MAGKKPDGSWARPPGELLLAEGEVHLWRVDLGMELPRGTASVLLPEELERAERFRFERDRHSFLLSSYALRVILGRYLGMPGREVPIRVSPGGKPYIEGKISFSLSHTGGVAVVAVARRAVGVDVEGAVEDYPHLEVAEGFFAWGEVEALRAERDGKKRVGLFFSFWTRKEALLKASGEGISVGLGGIDFSRAAGRVMEYKGKEYTIVELEPEGRVFCSLALEGGLTRMQRYEWEPEA